MQIADPSILIFRPLRIPDICAVVTALALVFAAYCMLHGVVADGSVHPAVSIVWGLSHALCWWPAWECVKRAAVLRKRWTQAVAIVGVSLLALTSNVVCGYAISAWVSPEAHPDWIEIAYQRFPIACALAIAAIALRPWRSRPPAVRATSQTGRYAVPSCAAAEGAFDSRGDDPAPRIAMPVQPTSTGAAESMPEQFAATEVSRSSRAKAMPTTLSIPTRHGVVQVSAAEIDYVKAAGNYVELFARDRSWLLRATLREIAAQLHADGFVRVHRSVLANRHRVLSVERSGQRLSLAMRCGARVPVGRQYRHITQTLIPVTPGSTVFVPESSRSSHEL